eukprot:TRINITY_DN4220_c0_g1_i3.p1 TRINITY_DN4220_c0_g1~~TRINITY_DN4220_c0_g1_i3.p1  ORF type:complete len:420 (-),score=54.50 TRINITY_DN4220_c0_g1_i3:554-1813(-)
MKHYLTIATITLLFAIWASIATSENTTESAGWPVSCQFDDECEKYGFRYQCINYTSSGNDSKWCRPNSVIVDDEYVYILDILLILVLFIGGSIAAGGGIGGGGVFVPVLILVGRFSPKDAVPLSNCLIGGASIANYLQMGRYKHPTANRPLIYYNLAMLMQPLALGGTVIGVILNEIFPDWLTLALLMLTLTVTIIRTSKKWLRLHRMESNTKLKKSDDSSLEELITNDYDSSSTISKDAEYDTLIKGEKYTPWYKVVLLFLVLIVVSVHSLMTGGKRGGSIIGIERCTSEYWGVLISLFPVLLILTIFIIRYLIKNESLKTRNGYSFQTGDIRWTKKKTIATGLISAFAGILSSLLGIGGGMVLSPVMLELHVLPEVTAATSSFMIVCNLWFSLSHLSLVVYLRLSYFTVSGSRKAYF